MTRTQLGWAVPVDDWDRFVQSVREDWGCSDTHVRFELERAMIEFVDRDTDLARAESLLHEAVSVSELSSSTETPLARNVSSVEKRTVNFRVREAVKEEFKQFVAELNSGETGKFDMGSTSHTTYGETLAAALLFYADGGRSRCIRELTESLVTGRSTAGARTTVIDESPPPADDDTLSTPTAASSTPGDSDDTDDLNPDVVLTVADDLPTEFLEDELQTTVAKHLKPPTVEDPIDRYSEAVLDCLSVVQHPMNDGLYIPEEKRDEITAWEDLTKELRTVRLRRLVAGDAVRNRNRRHSVTYRDVMELFEQNLGDGPSHDYAYTLMEAAAEGVDGLQYTTSRGQNQLRVNLDIVDSKITERGSELFPKADDLHAGTPMTARNTTEAPGQTATDGGQPTQPTG